MTIMKLFSILRNCAKLCEILPPPLFNIVHIRRKIERENEMEGGGKNEGKDEEGI